MSRHDAILVAADDDGLRLDRWLRKHYPGAGFAELQKLLRTGQIRVDGHRVKAGFRLQQSMAVRVPPRLREEDAVQPRASAPPRPMRVDAAEAEALRRRVLFRNRDVLAIDKPAGLAVQGGTGTRQHLDGMLDALRFDADERPRLVHRLDRDTSGVLLLARNREAARHLTAAFRARETRKLYLAVTAGVPRPRQGKIDLSLGKGGAGRERMVADSDDARSAITLYSVLDKAGTQAALVALMPLTGRTHQLRAHLQAIGTPILGDGKYGGRAAFLQGLGLGRGLHLHARSLTIIDPTGARLRLTAPLPNAMKESLKALGLHPGAEEDPFP